MALFHDSRWQADFFYVPPALLPAQGESVSSAALRRSTAGAGCGSARDLSCHRLGNMRAEFHRKG